MTDFQNIPKYNETKVFYYNYGKLTLILHSDISFDDFPKLYYTTKKKYKKDIEKGRKPINWDSFYMKIEDEDNLTYDRTEGISSIKNTKEVVFKNPTRNCRLHGVSFKTKKLNGIISCFHDEHITKEQRNHFGHLTYEVLDIKELAFSIMREVYEYLIGECKERNPENCYNGMYAFIGECKYRDSKVENTDRIKLEDLEHSSQNFIKNLTKPGGQFEMFGGQFITITEGKPKNLKMDVEKDFFIKPTKYKDQSEWRLCIVPISETIPNKNKMVFTKKLDSSLLKEVRFTHKC